MTSQAFDYSDVLIIFSIKNIIVSNVVHVLLHLCANNCQRNSLFKKYLLHYYEKKLIQNTGNIHVCSCPPFVS